MNREPLVTIILPVYNADRYISKAIQSVVDQSYRNWELIIINDGSTDGTAVYLDSTSHSEIRVIHQQNRGVSAARNVGLEEAKGEYITFLDADDVLPPRSLEARSKYLQEHLEVDVVDGYIITFEESLSHEIRQYKPYYHGLLLPRLLRLDSRVFFGIVYMFRRSILADNQFRVNLTHCEDLLFYIAIASAGHSQYGFVEEEIYHCRTSSASVMSNMEGLEKGYLTLLESVQVLQGTSLFDKVYLKVKVASILFLCWRSKGKYLKGGIAAAKCLFQRGGYES